jgi:hypothetical protein
VSADLLRELREHVVFARQALELGDPAIATGVLRDLETRIGQAQAHEIARQRRRRSRQRVACPSCGTRFGWPGELDEHERRVHADEEDA